MREIGASEAKTHLSELLDAVERGESIVITRRGRPIARVVPERERRQKEVEEALDDLEAFGKEIRQKHGSVSIEEILAWRHEGHKY